VLLKLVVLTLAMLLPVTSRLRALAFKPERPVNIAMVEAIGESLLKRDAGGKERDFGRTDSQR
jgi:hypothetical protein